MSKLKVFVLLVVGLVALVDSSRITALRNFGCIPNRSKKLVVKTENVVDLTHEMNETSAIWPTDMSLGYRMLEIVKGMVKNGPFNFFLSSHTFTTHELAGTHVDAPHHFSATGKMATDIEFKEMIAPGVLIDLVNDGAPFPRNSMITIGDIVEWEMKNGRIRSGTIVLLRTGYGSLYWSDRDGYYGTSIRGPEAAFDLHVPGLDPEAAMWLLKHRCIAAVGIDQFTIDEGQRLDFPTHHVFADADVAVYEDLANLDKLVANPKGFYVFSMPLKLKDGAGSPIRIIAFRN